MTGERENLEYPQLEWNDGDRQVQCLAIIDKVFIGRICQGIDDKKRILLKNPLVSRVHAEITWTAAYLQITDTSKNGTWVNDIRMAAGSSKILADGDVIRIGESSFKVVYPKNISDDRDDFTINELTMVASVEATVTNLVADLRGFSAFSQEHASSEVYGMIKEIFDALSVIVQDFKGTIKDYAGDAVFAYWDHQVESPTNQAVLVCQAAIQQTRTFEGILAQIAGKYADVENLQMGWGISTGKVTMAHYGLRAADMAMVGDCINLAFRLSDMANKDQPEKILICSQTAELVDDQLALKDLGMFPIKGRSGRERIFALDEMNRFQNLSAE